MKNFKTVKNLFSCAYILGILSCVQEVKADGPEDIVKIFDKDLKEVKTISEERFHVLRNNNGFDFYNGHTDLGEKAQRLLHRLEDHSHGISFPGWATYGMGHIRNFVQENFEQEIVTPDSVLPAPLIGDDGHLVIAKKFTDAQHPSKDVTRFTYEWYIAKIFQRDENGNVIKLQKETDRPELHISDDELSPGEYYYRYRIRMYNNKGLAGVTAFSEKIIDNFNLDRHIFTRGKKLPALTSKNCNDDMGTGIFLANNHLEYDARVIFKAKNLDTGEVSYSERKLDKGNLHGSYEISYKVEAVRDRWLESPLTRPASGSSSSGDENFGYQPSPYEDEYYQRQVKNVVTSTDWSEVCIADYAYGHDDVAFQRSKLTVPELNDLPRLNNDEYAEGGTCVENAFGSYCMDKNILSTYSLKLKAKYLTMGEIARFECEGGYRGPSTKFCNAENGRFVDYVTADKIDYLFQLTEQVTGKVYTVISRDAIGTFKKVPSGIYKAQYKVRFLDYNGVSRASTEWSPAINLVL